MRKHTYLKNVQDVLSIKYSHVKRYGKKTKYTSSDLPRVILNISNPEMKKRSDFISYLDPAANMEDVANKIYKKYGGFLCKHCGKKLVFNGQNGAGTPSLRCKSCKKNMSIWNTFELSFFRYKKLVRALAIYFKSESIKDCGSLYGLGQGLLNEVRMCLPSLDYFKNGEINYVEKDGEKYAIVTSDMMYKGNKGLMLGVSGDLEIGKIGNERTGEGINEFLEDVKKKTDCDKFIIIMDMQINVARKIIEQFGKNVIIVLQNHSVWGDVLVYFYRNGWYTLHTTQF